MEPANKTGPCLFRVQVLGLGLGVLALELRVPEAGSVKLGDIRERKGFQWGCPTLNPKP